MVDHLGLFEDALHWWQRCREAAPLESVPILEQTTILADLGMYPEARDRLSALFEENLGHIKLSTCKSKSVTQDAGNVCSTGH